MQDLPNDSMKNCRNCAGSPLGASVSCLREEGMEHLRLCRRRSLISWGELPPLGWESLVSSLTCEGIPMQRKFHATEGKAPTA